MGIKVQRPRCFFDIAINNQPGKEINVSNIYIWIFNILNYLYMKKYKPATFFFSWKSCLWIIFWCVPQNMRELSVSLYRFVDVFTYPNSFNLTHFRFFHACIFISQHAYLQHWLDMKVILRHINCNRIYQRLIFPLTRKAWVLFELIFKRIPERSENSVV